MDTNGGEHSSRKRPRANEKDNGPSGKRKDSPNESSFSNNDVTVDNLICNQQQYCKHTGLRNYYHGVSYQMNLILLVLLQMHELMEIYENLLFEITTDDPDAGKFDDIVCKYTYNGIERVMSLQAKYKLAEHKITWGDVTSIGSKAAFSLAKYFTSFLDQRKATVNDQCFVLCTNADLDINVSDLCDELPPSNTSGPDMLDIFDRIGATCYRFNEDKLKKRGKLEEIKSIMEDCSDCNHLAKMLASHIYDKKKITLHSNLFKTYQNAIAYNIVGTSKGDPKLCVYNVKNEFIAADTQFKRAFEAEYKKVAKSDLDVWKDVSKKGIAFSQTVFPKNDAFTSQLPDDNVTDTIITSFFEKFILACSTRSEDQLPEIIMNVWQSTNFLNVTMVQKGVLETKMVYRELSENIYNWMMSAKKGPLRKDFVNTLFEGILKKFEHHKVTFETIRYIEIIKDFKLQIKKERLENSTLFKFLSQPSQPGQNIYQFLSRYEADFSMLIVYQTFLLCFGHDGSAEITFMESAKYLQNEDDTLCCTKTQKVLVVVCQEQDHDPDLRELGSYLNGNNNKVVFIKFAKNWSAGETVEDRILVGDLDSLEKNAQWNIFGTDALLADIIDDDDDVAVLLKLTGKCGSDSEIKTNSIVQEYEKIKDWYVQRDTQRSESKKLNQLGDDESTNAALHKHRQALNVSSFREVDKMSWNEFRSNVQSSFGQSSIDTEQIGNILDKHNNCVLYKPPRDPDDDDHDVKVHILLEEAGFGKSTYLTWLGCYLQQHDSTKWIIRFSAIEYSTDFRRLSDGFVHTNMDNDLALRILFQMTHLALPITNINRLSNEKVDIKPTKIELCAKCICLVDGKIKVDHKNDNHKLSSTELLAMRLFINKFNNRKLILIFDGFNETIPTYKQVLFDLLHKFEKLEGIDKMYLTSRSYKLKNDFESVFDDVKFYRLKPFSDEDRLVSIDSYLCNEIKEYKRCTQEQRTDLLISLESIIRYYLWNLRNSPLLTRMALDTLSGFIREHIDFSECQIFTKVIDTCDTKFEKLQLMESYVKKKVKTLFDKTEMTDSSRDAVQIKSKILKNEQHAETMYSFLALYVLFDAEERKKLLTEGDPKKRFLEYKNTVNRGEDQSGIVEAVHDDVPVFINRSLVEYFTALWFYNNKAFHVVNKFLRSPSFWHDNRREMREYFDRMFINPKHTIHLAVLDKSTGDIIAALQKKEDCHLHKDNAGRTPLHWVTLYYPHNISRFNVLLDSIKWDDPKNHSVSKNIYLNEKDHLLEWSALDYAFICNDSYAVQQLLEYGARINGLTLAQQVQQDEPEETLRIAVAYENLIVANAPYRCKKLDKALQTFTKEVTVEVAKYLIKEKQVDVQSPFIKVKENKLTSLDYCVEKNAGGLFVNLVEQAGGIKTILPDNLNGLLKRAVAARNLYVINYLIGKTKCTVPSIVDVDDLLYVIRMTISNHFNDLFKTLFKQFCRIEEIEYVDQYEGENENNGEQDLYTWKPAINFSQENEFLKLFSNQTSYIQDQLFRLLYISLCSGNAFTSKKVLSLITVPIDNIVMIDVMNYVRHDEEAGYVNRRYQEALIAVIEEKIKNPTEFGSTVKETLLHHALTCNMFQVARYLMDHKGFDLKQFGGKNKWNAFFYCLVPLNDRRFQNDRMELFKYMMEKDPYSVFSYKDKNKKTILNRAIEKNHYQIAKFLVENQLSGKPLEEREPLLVKYLKEFELANKRKSRDFFSYLLEKTSDASWKQIYTRVNERLSHIVVF